MLAVTACAAALAPHPGRAGFVRNWAVFLAEVCVLIGVLAALGDSLHDFLLSVN